MEIKLSKHRIEALSDGLFAIVMTLLVLEIKVPELHRPVTNEQLLGKLHEVIPNVLVFGLTFLLSSAFWFLHHLTVQPIRYMTRLLLWLNLGCLMFVSLLPFSAGLLGRYLNTQAAQMVYYANLMAIGLALAVQWTYANRKQLLADDVDPRLRTRLSTRVWLVPVGAAGALAGAAIQPLFAGIGFTLGALVVRLVSMRRERAAIARGSR